ncbi:MAG TPA: hypothetical protein PKC28_03055 [Bdellovibrionales bacterium]|nr:hypothetical protein [Bdellovibrionales bacterium]
MAKFMALITALACLTGCASTPIPGMVQRACGKTPVNLSAMETLGFTPPKNKVVVMRIFATWCPYCKEDLAAIGQRFKRGQWTEDKVHILLLSYANKREGKDTYTEFITKTFGRYGIPASAAQIIFVDQSYKELMKIKGKDGKALFTTWKGVPFALLFGKDGRLVFRGHFTTSPQVTDGHYRLIGELVQETCGG